MNIKEYFEKLKSQKRNFFAYGFEKIKRLNEKVTDQDKKHCRLIAIAKMCENAETFNYVKSKEFEEKFLFDEEKHVLYYVILIKQDRKEIRKNADA